jgi:FixJ family two-component response regulator
MTQNRRPIDTAPDAQLISVVDDNELVREAITSLLRSVGFKGESFSSAEKFLNSPSLSNTACLILDVRMPGLSGPELQRRLAGKNRRIPIIFITAHGDARIRAKVMRAGAVDLLTKPFTDEAFLRAVRSGLEAGTTNQDFQPRKQTGSDEK